MITGVILGTAALGLIVSLFGDRYECSPEEVQEACEELSNISNNTLQAISDEIGKEVGIVNNAASAASGLLDISNMNAYAPAVQDSITNLISVLDKQAEMIEEYNNGNLVEKMLGTGTMAILNLTEGVLKFGEDIVDAGANIIAGVGTFCGFDMEEVELWAAKDHIGDAFDDAFENGALSWVEKYSIYSHESTAAEIFKGIGTAIPYIVIAATGVGVIAEAGIAGAAGFGRGSTNYQQQHLVYDANGEAGFDETYSTGSMMWEGAKQGAIDAATVVIMDKGMKAIGNKISSLKAGKAAAESADDVTKALTTTSDDAGKALINSTDNVANAASNASQKTAYELTEELNKLNKLRNKMPEAEFKKAKESIYEQLKKVHQDVLDGQAAREAKEMAEQTAREMAEQTAIPALPAPAEKVAEQTAREMAEQTVKKTASATGPRIGDNTIPARVTRAFDNAVEGLKNVGAKAGSAVKGVVTDTAAFVKANPKRALIGGGIIAGEKAIGNMKTSYIPTNYASAEVQELSKVGGGENRIVIDEVDDLIAQTGTDTPTTPEPTQPSQTYTGGTSTGGGTYTAPTTPSSNNNTTTTPIEKPGDSNTTTPGTNDDNNNNNDNQDNNKSDDLNKTPDNNTPATPEPTPGDNVNTEVSNPPSNNNQGSSGTNHGGTTNNNTGNSSTGNNNWNSNTTTESGIEENPELEPELPIEDSDLIDEPNEEESVYTIPSNLSGVKQTKKTSSGSSVLPILGGLGAAAAVGVGAKMYLDNKKNNENGDDDEEYSDGDDENFNTSENDDLLADEWNGEDTEFNYEDSSGDNSVETDDDDLGEM
ncbi:MAG: cell envelope integrity protein TolA [Bacilli bacterium]|nr:cell envelope integrity protein TolA [Bacilli bacterium]